MLALPPALAVAFASLALPLRILLWLLLALMMRNFFALALVVCLPPLLTFLLPFCVMAGRSPWLGPRSQAHIGLPRRPHRTFFDAWLRGQRGHLEAWAWAGPFLIDFPSEKIGFGALFVDFPMKK